MAKSQKGIPCPARGHKPRSGHPWSYENSGDKFYSERNKHKYKPEGHYKDESANDKT